MGLDFFGGLGGKVGAAAERGGSFFSGLGGKAGSAVERGGGFLDGKVPSNPLAGAGTFFDGISSKLRRD
jgi:hypothetical protein